MTTLYMRRENQGTKAGSKLSGDERREHRRHLLEHSEIAVERWDAGRRHGRTFGQLVDISAGGARIRTSQTNVRVDNQIRVRLELPDSCGICPFVDTSHDQLQPKKEWIGWMTVNRVEPAGDGQVDVAGRLVDMEDLDRGMLGLYLSTHPIAA